MGRWCVEMAYGIGFTVDIRAKNREEAIEKAKLLVQGTTILPFDNSVEERGLEFQGVTYAQESLVI